MMELISSKTNLKQKGWPSISLCEHWQKKKNFKINVEILHIKLKLGKPIEMQLAPLKWGLNKEKTNYLQNPKFTNMPFA